MENNVLRIVSWNCHWGLNEKKYQEIMSYSPHILIIQESRKIDFDYIKSMWKFKNWYNDDFYTDKSECGSEYGVAIFSNDYKIEFTEIFNRKYRYVVPYIISKDSFNLNLFIIWIKPINGNYLKPLYDAIEYYQDKKMLDNNTIVIGDFNTFAKDDNGRLKDLEEKLKPLINCTANTPFHTKDTYYNSKHGYGIDDFCFVSKDNIGKFEVDIPNDLDDKNHQWKGISDHCPIIVDFAF
jgi:exonuclease III